jgi:acyl transferase domain-containing protein/acyl carrier protein
MAKEGMPMNAEQILQALMRKEIRPDEAKALLASGKGQTAAAESYTNIDGRRNKPADRTVAGREAIAIVGMSGKYPEADDLPQYWDNLSAGRNSVKEIPPSRWNTGNYYNPHPQKGKIYAKWLGMLEDFADFDPLFFHISPTEAEWMDPQHRLFLQEGYKAFEDAGYSPQRLDGMKCGLYLGIMSSEYGALCRERGKADMSSGFGFAHTTGSSYAIAAARLAYYLNLKGPAIPIDTACSSSLVAVHLACQALLNREIDMALAGGVSLYLTPETYVSMCDAGMLSPDGQCKAFDNSANGFIPGEGVGAIVLKRLGDAEADGDSIHGVILGSGVNQDGRTNGITAPSLSSQMELVRDIYEKYGIDPESIGYVEMHGTGTKLGDPIELEAISAVFKGRTNRKGYCAIGSVKSNIGHTSGAAGIAGIQKAVLLMRHKKLVPTLHYRVPNEHYSCEDSPFYVNTETKDWESREGAPRRTAVSSFGFSGTNAHLVLEEYTDKRPSAGTGVQPLFVLSAKSGEQLADYARSLAVVVASREQIDLADVAYTLQTGRDAMDVRLAFQADSRKAVIDALNSYLSAGGGDDMITGRALTDRRLLEQDLTPLMNRCIRQRKAKPALELWVQGAAADWDAWYGDCKPRRISLPTYPFLKERYWLPPVQGAGDIAAAEQHRQEAERNGEDAYAGRSLRMLRKEWKPCPLRAEPGSNRGTVAILASEETKPLALLLSHKLAPARIIGPEQLRGELDKPAPEQAAYSGLIDLIGCGKQRSGEAEDWITWLQRLVEFGSRDGMTLIGVTRGLEAEDGPANLPGAVRAGLYRMLQSEYSHLRSRHVDFGPDCGEPIMAETIAAELLADSEEAEVRYLSGTRYRACLGELPMDIGEATPVSFPEGQTLWITGGTRGIGALCAKHFVNRRGVRRLVLTGREAFPPRQQWEAYEADADSAIGRKIRAVRELEALGAEVKVLSLDLTDEEAVRRCFDEVRAAWGRIGGVLHCAGIVDQETPAFIRKSGSGIREVLAPKTAGLDVLLRCMKSEPLQFFMLFSSVSSIVPALASGQSDYAMANAYMDYAAQAWCGEIPVVSVQWPNWKETGIGEVKSRIYQQSGLLSHTNDEGLRLLDRILARGLGPVVLPAVIDPQRWKPEQLLLRSLGSGQGEPQSQPVRQGTAHNNGQDGREGLLYSASALLTGIFAKELKLAQSRLDPDTPFTEYGVDSIMLAQVLRTVRQSAGIDLDPSVLYEYPTIRLLSEWLADKHGASFSLGAATNPEEEASDKDKGILGATLNGREKQPVQPTPEPKSDPVPATAVRTGTGPADIAVIGLSCRFPGAETPDGYWRLLSEGRSAIRTVTRDNWTGGAADYAGLLDCSRTMPASHFRLSEEDANAMDPQALLLLEESLKAWHHAGYVPEEIKERSIGVYIGARSRHEPDEASLLQARNPILAVGTNYLAANISQYFDLRGPSVVLDTACSSALVGLNVAVQALLAGEIECALVGGVSLLVSDKSHRLFRQRGILSPEPQFHIFDGKASGVVLSEGAGIVLLKPVAQALIDGDRIYAVIKGVAVNNDGRTAGPAAPNYTAQTEVMRQALARSGKQPEEIGYIEANGSGSEVNDLLELKATQAVYRKAGGPPLCIGSAKPNIGHPLCAEGIAGLIKLVLMLDRRGYVPFLSGHTPMKHFDIGASPFYFSREHQEWTGPRTAALNCFADGGTNAHIILEGWEELRGPDALRRPLPLPAMEPDGGPGGITGLEGTDDSQPGEAESEPIIWESYA